MLTLRAEDFEQWRAQARALLARGTTPADVGWVDAVQPGLFSGDALPAPESMPRVPPEFIRLARVVACHRDARRWSLLYQMLYRLTHGEKHLLRIVTDPLTHALRRMEQAVRRDAHKMKAFVRFRLVEEEGREHYIAWHRPDHFIVPQVAPFFARRFGPMEWTILTPDASVHWNGEALAYGAGVPVEEAPPEDALESLWRDYYRATFNPARIKLKTMKREMPVRHWATLPETQIIADMLAEAPTRVQAMLKHSEGSLRSAANYLPVATDIPHLRAAATGCHGCELHEAATQTVFGTGPADARIMLVGEQPGNDEDLAGEPFVGPAGAVLDEALANAGLQRRDLYITNAVKHFRFVYTNAFRQHRSPARDHVRACKPWLDAEITAVKPTAILCLGNIAARALIGPNFVMKTGRGVPVGDSPVRMASYHPSAILRAPASERGGLQHLLVADLRMAAQLAAQAP